MLTWEEIQAYIDEENEGKYSIEALAVAAKVQKDENELAMSQ